MIDFENFHWLTALKVASQKGVSNEEYAALVFMANGWPTCACGELCRNLPRMRSGQPDDGKLLKLGYKFNDTVRLAHWEKALKTFHAIEARTAELLEKGAK